MGAKLFLSHEVKLAENRRTLYTYIIIYLYSIVEKRETSGEKNKEKKERTKKGLEKRTSRGLQHETERTRRTIQTESIP